MENKEIIELLEKSIAKIGSIKSDVDRASLYASSRATSSYCDYASSGLSSLKHDLSTILSELKQDKTDNVENTDDNTDEKSM